MYKNLILSKTINLSYVPPEDITYQLCEIAVYHNMDDLKYVPPKFLSRELIMIALEKGDHKLFGSSLQYVPEYMIDYEMCVTAVKNNGYAIQYVPFKFQEDYLFALAFYKKDPLVIQFIPEVNKSLNVCTAALSCIQNSELYEYSFADRIISFFPDGMKPIIKAKIVSFFSNFAFLIQRLLTPFHTDV